MYSSGNLLKDLKIIVVGAGPGGLTFAKAASLNGADVMVIERAGSPHGLNPGYTDRSFNLTLNEVGRKILGEERAWQGGTDVIGRAIHNFQNTGAIKYTEYGEGDKSILTSVPRPVLRQNLVNIVEDQGVKIHFHTKVVEVEPNLGKVVCENKDAIKKELKADVIVLADGIHSLSDVFITALPGGSLGKKQDPLSYISVMLGQKAAKGLSSHHMHFWHKAGSESVAIGMPNKDGTIATLLISPYKDVIDESPFSMPDQAIERLKQDFPEVLSLEPDLANQVVGRKLGHFHYKSITNYILGDKCIVVGDAGSASPPWAGFGANTAIYSADVLARFLIGCNGDIQEAFLGYEKYKIALAELVLDYANEHGEFLNKEVAERPEKRPIGPVLGQIINKAMEKSDIPDGVELLSF
ncbi:MAG TPA: NAD(P)/FAD-dependent oxidoreductase [Candidatus Saccharimonadales bacterium]|nr:NAD(P)/FAD-dependent oxidoreductase [Candidatus Saccharimonadales bacterium]